MPRLNHKKARTGCQRCKARKVKCDEGKPKCAACARHHVSCEYLEPAPRRSEPQQQAEAYARGSVVFPPDSLFALDSGLEIRLMHQWTAYTSETFSTASAYWRCQVPLDGLEHRTVLDAMFGLAALHASRQSPTGWIPAEGRMMPFRHPVYKQQDAPRDLSNQWKESQDSVEMASVTGNIGQPDYLAERRRHELLLSARKYFNRAIDGHRAGIQAITKDNVDAIYVTSVLVSFQALFSLSEPEDNPALPAIDPIVWLRLADSTRYLCDVWQQMFGEEWLDSTGMDFGRPKFQGVADLFQREQGRPFEKLLTFAEEIESITLEDKATYQECVAYLAFVYKTIIEEGEAPLATCRRLVAMPSQLPRRFNELVELKAPRAMVILAYTFAAMKMISHKVPWFQGIAERQVPKLQQQVPPGWNHVMKWPLDITGGCTAGDSNEETIRDILTL